MIDVLLPRWDQHWCRLIDVGYLSQYADSVLNPALIISWFIAIASSSDRAIKSALSVITHLDVAGTETVSRVTTDLEQLSNTY